MGEFAVLPRKNILHEAAKRIDVTSGVHPAACQQLRRSVSACSAEATLKAAVVVGKAEVYQFKRVACPRNKDILRLQVVVNHALTMEVSYSPQQFLEHSTALF